MLGAGIPEAKCAFARQQSQVDLKVQHFLVMRRVIVRDSNMLDIAVRTFGEKLKDSRKVSPNIRVST
jgi:hypothetical protein